MRIALLHILHIFNFCRHTAKTVSMEVKVFLSSDGIALHSPPKHLLCLQFLILFWTLCPFFIVLQPFDRIQKSGLIHPRLQYVVACASPHRLPDILKLIIAGKHDHFSQKTLLLQLLKHLYPIHTGHINIQDYQIRLQPLSQAQTALPIRSFTNDFKSIFFPVNCMNNPNPNQHLIVCNQNLHLIPHPDLSFLISAPLQQHFVPECER